MTNTYSFTFNDLEFGNNLVVYDLWIKIFFGEDNYNFYVYKTYVFF